MALAPSESHGGEHGHGDGHGLVSEKKSAERGTELWLKKAAQLPGCCR